MSNFLSQLASYRDLVMPLLRDAVPDREPRRHLYDPIQNHLSRPGKALRPALCIATAQAFGGRADNALPSAAALELLHNAFLVHDDVEDGSEFRRDEPTMQTTYGVPIAVNTGDAMQALSIGLLKQNLPLLGPERTWMVLDEFDHMMIETIEGQAMELGWIRDNNCNVTDDDYLVMVLKKTCWYSFIHPCRLGALASGRRNLDLSAFDRFGFFLGAAFQIQDDILNLVGDAKKYGKEIDGDLWEGKRTLILTHFFGHCSGQEKDRVRQFLSRSRATRLSREVGWLKDRLGHYGSIDHARNVAHEFLNAARNEFRIAFADTAGPDKDFVSDLIEYAVSRDA